MSGRFNHSPGEVIRQMLVDLSLGTLPESVSSWPTYYSFLPEDKNTNNLLCVYDTAAVMQGRTFDGETQKFFGFQIAIKSNTLSDGRNKGRAILDAIDTDTHNLEVELEGSTYLLHSVDQTGDLIYAGMENPTTRRRLFTINGLVCLTMTDEPGTGTGS